MKLLTSKAERRIRMEAPRLVSRAERTLFPIAAFLVTSAIAPAAVALLGMFFFGNLLKESGVTEKLANTARNGLIDTVTGGYRDVMTVPFHVHHVFFISNERLLVNHTQGENGMWTVNIDGSAVQTLRSSADGHGAVCHQVITENGLFYEANETVDGERRVWIGRYDLNNDTFVEERLPNVGYVHTGRDPAGKLRFFENQEGSHRHQLLLVHEQDDHEQDDAIEIEVLRELAPIIRGQRYHAHPFLSPDRQWLFFNEVIDGFSQICALEMRLSD
jgi:hypothetical protein